MEIDAGIVAGILFIFAVIIGTLIFGSMIYLESLDIPINVMIKDRVWECRDHSIWGLNGGRFYHCTSEDLNAEYINSYDYIVLEED